MTLGPRLAFSSALGGVPAPGCLLIPLVDGGVGGSPLGAPTDFCRGGEPGWLCPSSRGTLRDPIMRQRSAEPAQRFPRRPWPIRCQAILTGAASWVSPVPRIQWKPIGSKTRVLLLNCTAQPFARSSLARCRRMRIKRPVESSSARARPPGAGQGGRRPEDCFFRPCRPRRVGPMGTLPLLHRGWGSRRVSHRASHDITGIGHGWYKIIAMKFSRETR